MTEKQAKEQLARMLERYTAGSLLHLLADIYKDVAEEARQDGDQAGYEQCKSVERTLFVVGLGVDAARPS